MCQSVHQGVNGERERERNKQQVSYNNDDTDLTEWLDWHHTHKPQGPKSKQTYLNTRLPKVDTKAVSISGVVLDQLLQSSKSGSSGNEEATLVQLPDAVVLDCVSVSNTE